MAENKLACPRTGICAANRMMSGQWGYSGSGEGLSVAGGRNMLTYLPAYLPTYLPTLLRPIAFHVAAACLGQPAGRPVSYHWPQRRCITRPLAQGAVDLSGSSGISPLPTSLEPVTFTLSRGKKEKVDGSGPAASLARPAGRFWALGFICWEGHAGDSS